MKQQVMYHYTNPKGWAGIANGQDGYVIEHPITKKMVDSETVKGWMIPHRRLIPQGIESSLVPWEATSPAIFGLPEPTPQSWMQYRDCINVWDYLLSCCKSGADKLALLKINLVDSDNSLVFDYVHIRRSARDLAQTKDPDRYRKILAEGNRDYWNSRVELNRYDGSFVLPEIVVFSAIPIERIEFLGERDRELFAA
ncbi:MAG: hypothetical protein KKB21_04495 [Nanoarchaeota archaeon]|nr:hypothetical protein [Nanoarchaeota archaeon]MBU4086805.1 hypothetical protein [Nanoarchaeota archaeon]